MRRANSSYDTRAANQSTALWDGLKAAGHTLRDAYQGAVFVDDYYVTSSQWQHLSTTWDGDAEIACDWIHERGERA